jgi:hypothetical protein
MTYQSISTMSNANKVDLRETVSQKLQNTKKLVP